MKKTFIINGEEVTVGNLEITDGAVRFTLDGKDYAFEAPYVAEGRFVLRQNGRNRAGYVAKRTPRGEQPVFLHGGVEAQVEPKGARRSRGGAGKGAPHTAPMPGTVQKVLVKAGDSVEAGQPLVVMEAMKLQLTIEAAYSGAVEDVCCAAGELVQDGALLVKIARLAEAA